MKIIREQTLLNILALSTALIGVLTLGNILGELIYLRHARLVLADAHLSVIAGVSLIYLAMLLRRGKYNAWLISLVAYGYLLIRNFRHFVFDDEVSRHYLLLAASNLLFPLVVLAGLVLCRHLFKVRSEPLGFMLALRRAAIILAVALLYGIIGFQLFDARDFHQEISPVMATHYTLDQFGLTTHDKPVTHTKRAVLFVDSLASVSIASLVYVAVAFFSPVRFRLSHSRRDYEDIAVLIRKHSRTSEDFFKLWPHDKTYYFSPSRSSAIAYRVAKGVALAVGDPVGPKNEISGLLENFIGYCRLNDWTPAFIHTDKANLKQYANAGFTVQKIGEEAIVEVGHFVDNVARSKYFRQINNRFIRQGYHFEILHPPHDAKVVGRLKNISNDWLCSPGRAERGFMMGYFSEAYIQQCSLAVGRDGHGEIQAFLNQAPGTLGGEATYDFLRSSTGSPGNINDYLMLNFILYLKDQGFKKFNMGLSPLSGLEAEPGAERTSIDKLLHFVYANADRFYSFAGLARFKSKYQPKWQDRYIVYKGGLTGFSRTMNALLGAMGKKGSG